MNLPQHQYGSTANVPVSAANGYGDRPSSQGTIDEEISRSPQVKREDAPAARRADPMSFSNILSGDTPEPPKPAPRPVSTSKSSKSNTDIVNGETKITSAPSRKSAGKNSTPKTASAHQKSLSKVASDPPSRVKHTSSQRRKAAVNIERDNEKIKAEMAKIEAMEMSDIESPAYDEAKENFTHLKRKREAEVEKTEIAKRKVKTHRTCLHDSVLT